MSLGEVAGVTKTARWSRAVLKISGEALASPASDETIDAPTVRRIAEGDRRDASPSSASSSR